ncbi:MAG: hypothetical protein KAI43_14225 [Candidatus Aureabacteria bacterium]|nr:hypothetical protein [Candidatus Auribacterota bacterium]
MWTSGTNEIYQSAGFAGTEQTSTEKKPGDVNKQDFMLLLMAQLQNQDPSEPVSNSEFLAQLAQFNQMEAMSNMGENIEALVKTNNMARGGSLIGRVITGVDKFTGESVRGFVAKVSMLDDEVTLHTEQYDSEGNFLGQNDVLMDSITEIEF